MSNEDFSVNAADIQYDTKKIVNQRTRAATLRFGYFEGEVPQARQEWSTGLDVREQHHNHVVMIQKASEAQFGDQIHRCLICDKKLGSMQYVGSAHGYCWNVHEGYLHYVDQHKVELREELLAAVAAIGKRRFRRK